MPVRSGPATTRSPSSSGRSSSPSAGFLQYLESVTTSGPSASGWGLVLAYRPRQIDWWASGIQLVGTVLFNISTANAIRANLSAQAAHHHIWRPDALGSVCFLVASGMAWFEVCHGWAAWSPRDLSWWIVALNLTGSIAFGASAVAAYIVPFDRPAPERRAVEPRDLRRRPVLSGRRHAAPAGANRSPGRPSP